MFSHLWGLVDCQPGDYSTGSHARQVRWRRIFKSLGGSQHPTQQGNALPDLLGCDIAEGQAEVLASRNLGKEGIARRNFVLRSAFRTCQWWAVTVLHRSCVRLLRSKRHWQMPRAVSSTNNPVDLEVCCEGRSDFDRPFLCGSGRNNENTCRIGYYWRPFLLAL